MSEQQSPWARPEPGANPPADVLYPPPPTPFPSGTGIGSGSPAPGSAPAWSRSGTVTLPYRPPDPEPDVIEFGRPRDPASRQRRTLLWFGGAAGLVLVIGAVVLLTLTMTGNGPVRRVSGPSDYRPPLAKACPPPSDDAQHLPPVPAPPPGPRTVDNRSGISYAAQGSPWEPWSESWSAGDLHVQYAIGQHFVTEVYSGGAYHASILSGAVPVAENDALTLDLKCTGHQVLADVRASYYPRPNTIETMRDEVTVLGGRPAWVAKFRLHFHAEGLTATSELVGLALINVGRPNAAVLYISIPNTVSRYDPVVDQVLDSVRPT